MTPAERAKASLTAWDGQTSSPIRCCYEFVAEAIHAAVAEEREAIKKLVATHLNDGAQTDDGISADRTAAIIIYEIEQRSGVPTYDPVEMPK